MANKSFPRLPYLSWVDNPANTITIRYGTTRKDIDTITYGEQGRFDLEAETNYGTEKEVTLRNLKPETTYRYRIDRQKTVYSFRTAPSNSNPFSFVVYGDYSSNGNPSIKKQLYRAVLSEHPAFVLFPGDVVSNGNYPHLWKKEFFSPASILSPYFPIMIAPGNHDKKSLFGHYFSYPGNQRWYSFTCSNAQFIAIDTESDYSPHSSQYQFIEQALRTRETDWQVVFLHKPPYSTNRGHHSNLRVRASLCPLFEKYQVDMVFCGHNHGYERTRPIQQNRVDRQNGVTYIISGGGGAALLPFIPRSRLTAAERSWSKVRISKHHYLLVKASQHRWLIQAKTASRKTIDEFTLTK